MNSFIGNMDTLSNQILTENGAVQLSTTGEYQVDMFFNTGISPNFIFNDK